jgi:transposase-like protein
LREAADLVDEDEFAMRDWAEALVARARADGVELTGEGGLLTGLIKQVLQTGLEVEMEEHLGYERHDPAGRGSGNSRNGSYPKTVTAEVGQVELAIPGDRAGTFEPVTVPKYARQLDGLAGNVISLYGKGMTTGRSRRTSRRCMTRRSVGTRSARSPTGS